MKCTTAIINQITILIQKKTKNINNKKTKE